MSTVYAAVYIPAPILSLCCAAGSQNPDIGSKQWARDLAAKLLTQLKGAPDNSIIIKWDKTSKKNGKEIKKNEITRDRLPRYMYEDTVRKYEMDNVAPEVSTKNKKNKFLKTKDAGTYYQDAKAEEPSEIDLVYDEDMEDGIEEGEADVAYDEMHVKDYHPTRTVPEIEADVKSRIKSLTLKDLSNVIIGSPGSPYQGQILLEFKTYLYPRSIESWDLDYFYIKIVADARQLDYKYLRAFYSEFLKEYAAWSGPQKGSNKGKKYPACTMSEFLKNVKNRDNWLVISLHDGRNDFDDPDRFFSDDIANYTYPEDWSYSESS